MVATALRALFDLVCLRRKRYSSIGDIEGDLRIGRDDLAREVAGVTARELKRLADSYKKTTVSGLYEVLVGEFK